MPAGGLSPLNTYLAHLEKSQLLSVQSRCGEGRLLPRVILRSPAARTSNGASQRGWAPSATVVHPAKGNPYNVALIDCDEGFRLMSRVEDTDPMQVRIGQRVRFRVHRPGGEEPPCAVFVPAEGRS